MKIGHGFVIRREHYSVPREKPIRPESELSRAAREAGLTYDQLRGRVKLMGMSIEEAIAYQPPSPSEIARLGGLARAAKASGRTA